MLIPKQKHTLKWFELERGLNSYSDLNTLWALSRVQCTVPNTVNVIIQQYELRHSLDLQSAGHSFSYIRHSYSREIIIFLIAEKNVNNK